MKEASAIDLLAASGPFADYADKLMLYGQFVGAWDIEATYYQPNGGWKEVRGEWYFSWILGGFGVQDVLFGCGWPRHKYGTTLRCYDPALDAWHVTWMQPALGEFINLVGRKAGDRIIQDEVAPSLGKCLRWSFTDINPDTFRWLGEVSSDGGATWFLEEEMRARRRTSG